ncbi:MAG: LysM domain-containing protein [Dehalococcoidia bacterium]
MGSVNLAFSNMRLAVVVTFGLVLPLSLVAACSDDDPATPTTQTTAAAPPTETTTATATAGTGYTVKPGDTVYSIARGLGVAVTALRAANPQRDLDALQVGDELKVPLTGTRVTQCDPTALALTMRQERTLGYLLFQVDATGTAPCLLEHPLDLRVVDTTGQPLALITNPVRVGTDLQLPDNPVVRLEWSFWCGPVASYRLDVLVGGAKASFPIDGTPACEADVSISKLTVLSRADNPPSRTPTPTPVPGALERLYSVGDTVDVQVYAGTSVSGTPLCFDIVRDMIPSSLAATGVGAATVRCSMVPGERLHFVRDSKGRVYLDGIELLLIAKYTLPQNRASASCNAIRSQLIPANEAPDAAAYVLVCDVPVLPGGQSGAPLRIWARVRPDLLGDATVSADARCWELSRYLGAAGGHETTLVQCWID